MNEKLRQVIALIDAANQEDPQHERLGDTDYSKAYLYSLRMSETLDQFQADAEEALQIAIRAQHIRRWQIPRSDYPEGRAGYLKWRRDLGRFHADETAGLMRSVGYDATTIDEVKDLLTKQDLKRNASTQTLEDVACLVFVQHYLDDFASTQEHEKLINIIRKTWNKMSEPGRQAALALDLSPRLNALIQEALKAP